MKRALNVNQQLNEQKFEAAREEIVKERSKSGVNINGFMEAQVNEQLAHGHGGNGPIGVHDQMIEKTGAAGAVGGGGALHLHTMGQNLNKNSVERVVEAVDELLVTGVSIDEFKGI